MDSLGFRGIRGDSLGFAGIRWDSLGFVGIRWDSLGFAGIRWDWLGLAGNPSESYENVPKTMSKPMEPFLGAVLGAGLDFLSFFRVSTSILAPLRLHFLQIWAPFFNLFGYLLASKTGSQKNTVFGIVY